MLGKITKTVVDKLEPGSLLWDTSLVGFGVRRQLRHPHYIVRYRFSGKQKFITIGKHGAWTPETARREAQRLLGVVASGGDPAKPKTDGGTFGAVLERYLERRRRVLRPRTFVEVERHLSKHSTSLHSLRLSAITRRDIAEVLAGVETGSGMIARNRVRASLSAFLHWAITEGLIENNPVQGTAKANEGGGRERVLTKDELRRVWTEAGEDDFGQIVKLLLLTGQRRNEVGCLQWSEVNLTEGVIVFAASRTKNQREHMLPLSRQASAILAEARPNGDTVFRCVHWARAKERLDRRVGIAHWTLHDLRRSMATHCAELGVQPHIIEAILNHVSGHKSGVAGIYNRASYLGPMREALQRWADHITSLTS